jgi:hypothetical protein
MKTRLHYALCLLLGSMLFLSCGQENPDQSNTATLAPGVEDSIDLVHHPLSQERGVTQIATFKDSILIDSTLRPSVVADSIRIGAFEAMKTAALNLKGNYTGNYLLALRIIYGLDTIGMKMKLYYQPVFLKRDTVDGTLVFKPKASPDYYYYKYNNTSFARETNTRLIDAAKARYARHMCFKKLNGKFRRFYPGTTDTSDVTACLFPFQEITKMVEDNNATHVFIINSGEQIPVGSKTYLRHVMILGPDSMEHRVTPIFYRKYANLTHLCPPNCNQHIFSLIKTAL